MAKVFKIIGTVIMLTVIAIIIFWSWLQRSQEINFATLLPRTLSTCEGEVKFGTKKFEKLQLWLKSHESGWRNYPATPALGYIYRGDNITIYVYENSVVINYGIEKTWNQVQIHANTESINGSCN